MSPAETFSNHALPCGCTPYWMPLSGGGGRMQYSSPGNLVLYQGHASTQRTAYGLLVVGWNGMHLFGNVSPPGLYLMSLKLKPWQASPLISPPAPPVPAIIIVPASVAACEAPPPPLPLPVGGFALEPPLPVGALS